MALRRFLRTSPITSTAQPAPLYDNQDIQDIVGAYARPWQSRFGDITITTTSAPVWSGRYPSVAARNIIVNTILGAHLNAFSGGVIAQYRGLTWRDNIMSSLAPPSQNPPPPAWVPAENVQLDSDNYPQYALNLSKMWSVNLDVHIMTMWALSDYGPLYEISVPTAPMPAMTTAALMAYIGCSITQLAMTAYQYAGQLPQTAAATMTTTLRWLAAIWFGSLCGVVHRNHTVNGFYFDFGKPGFNPDHAVLKWNDGNRAAPPAAARFRVYRVRSPHWQQMTSEVAGAILAQSVTAVAGLTAMFNNRGLPVWAQNIPHFTGAAAGTRVSRTYNPVTMAAARHQNWQAAGLITAVKQAELDQQYTDYAQAIEVHLTAQLAANPVANGRMPIQPFLPADFAAAGGTNQVVADARLMFP
ncbi:VP6 [American grass carp reovirus]|uniref:Clamp protein VP6 n=1 Tax=Aquareovirus G (isolate American grass carp/USA/PB01-155/-) TaxID=648234 RepID=VP6_AQRVG|nr:VP6 [American grass carp reovirus]B2BNE7.1 RecName: Full=Clamp protein VP6 [American grass carp reovirus PB01-155]ABV01047.1 VP6 [American grass carp reovirus]